jgi:Tol biopolymer transport system component
MSMPVKYRLFLHMKKLVWVVLSVAALGQERRALRVDDVHQQRTIADPQVSPDEKWVAYTVASSDVAGDKSDTDVWMVNWESSVRTQVTSSKEPETSPRWSPDNRWLAFLSARADKEKGAQVWLLPWVGGEATQITSVEGAVSDYAWSPDSKRLVLQVMPRESEPRKEGHKPKTPKPVVIDHYRFKQDGEGYRTKGSAQLWLIDVASRKAERLTKEGFAEVGAVWSPDGSRIAFFSDRAGSSGRYSRWSVCFAESAGGAAVQVLTDDESVPGAGRGARLQWSADSSRVYFMIGRERKYGAYNRLSSQWYPRQVK